MLISLSSACVSQVKFKGDKEDSWLPAEDVPSDLVAKFEEKRAGKMEKRPREEATEEQSPAKAPKTAVTSAPSPAKVAPANLEPAVFKVMETYLKSNGIETLTKKKVTARHSLAALSGSLFAIRGTTQLLRANG